MVLWSNVAAAKRALASSEFAANEPPSNRCTK